MHRVVTSILENTRVNVFAIGDPDQCIYEELSGTNPAYLKELASQVEKRDQSEQVTLLHNYRCTNELIKVSEVIIGEPRGYQSDDNGGVCVCIQCSPGHREQSRFLTEKLLPKLKREFEAREVPMHKVAILHRKRGRLRGRFNQIG